MFLAYFVNFFDDWVFPHRLFSHGLIAYRCSSTTRNTRQCWEPGTIRGAMASNGLLLDRIFDPHMPACCKQKSALLFLILRLNRKTARFPLPHSGQFERTLALISANLLS